MTPYVTPESCTIVGSRESRVPRLFFIASSTPESEFLVRALRSYASLERFVTPMLALERMEMIERNDHVVLPDAVVTYEPRPHVFDGGFPLARGNQLLSTETIYEKMADLWPLVPRVTIGGAWCEGETRTGRPRRGEIRLEFGEAAWALRHELPRLVAGCSRWRFPPTTTDEERIQMNGMTLPVMENSPANAVAVSGHTNVEQYITTCERPFPPKYHAEDDLEYHAESNGVTSFIHAAQSDVAVEMRAMRGEVSASKIVYLCCEDRALTELLATLSCQIGWKTCEIAAKDLEPFFSRMASEQSIHSNSVEKIGVDGDSPEIMKCFSHVIRNVDVVKRPTLLLTAFPRFDEISMWQNLGVQVMPKPFQMAYWLDFLQSSPVTVSEVRMRSAT